MSTTNMSNNASKLTMGYIALIALSTLFYELSLIRILDVLWYPHFAYMVITLALLGFGIAGVVPQFRQIELPWAKRFWYFRQCFLH